MKESAEYKLGFDDGVREERNNAFYLMTQTAEHIAAGIVKDMPKNERYIAKQLHLALMRTAGLIRSGARADVEPNDVLQALIARA